MKIFIKKLIQILFCISVSLSLTQAYAKEEAAASNEIYTLGEVVITAPDERGVEAVATLREITDKDIELRNVKTLAKALELLPGVYIRKGAQNVSRVDIRGARSRHVVLLLNGIPFNSTYDGQFDSDTIPVENIAKIKVNYGNHSVLYGQGGLGGAINIITKKGTQGFSGSVAADIDERGNPDASADLSGGNDKANFFVSASEQKSDGFVMSREFTPTSEEDGGIRENSDYDRQSLYANAGFQAGEVFTIGVSFGTGTGDYGIPPSTINNNKDPFAKKPKYERVEDYEKDFGQVSMGYDPGGVFALRAWAFANKNKHDKTRYDDNNYNTVTNKGSYTTQDETRIKGATLQGTFDYEGYGKLAFSASGEKDEYDSHGFTVEEAESSGGGGGGGGGGSKTQTPLANVPHEISTGIDLYALAFEYDVTLFEKLGLVAGYSYHWQNKDQGPDDNEDSYLLGLSYDLTQTTRFRTSYSRKIRFASLRNLYDPQAGNPDLTTETSYNFEAGITQELPFEMTADLAFFLNNLENYISKETDPDTGDERDENHDEYEFKGMVLTLSKPFLETGLVRLAYSYLDSTDKSPGSPVDDLEYRPRQKISLDVNYTFDFGLTAYASFMHVKDQYIYDKNYNKGELDNFTLVDIKLEQNLFKDMWFVYAGVDNLFDENYQESYGFYQAGRTAYMGIKIKF